MQKPRHSWFETLVRARQVLAPRPPESRPASTSRSAELDRALTACLRTPNSAPRTPHLEHWPIEHCASEPEPFFSQLAIRSACVALTGALFFLTPLPASSAVLQVESIALTVNDLDREVRFFTQVLPFEKVSRSDFKGQACAELFGLSRAEVKVAVLKLGGESIALTEHLDKGRPIPADSRSYDHWFQHIAIVVRDMDEAYEHLRRQKVRYVSTSPQTLPEWNKAAAGIKAFYFRDPEDHVLEIIWFPRGKGNPKWQLPTDRLFLGIDHTAIVVSATDTSLGL